MVLNAKRTKLLEEDFSPHFSGDAIYKDLHLLQQLAFDLKRPLLTGAVTKELFGTMVREGNGPDDFSGIFRLFKS